MRTLRAADLFCGAGGSSLGLSRACERTGRHLDLVAVNHWPKAISTHSLNLAAARHHCAAIESLNPRRIVPGGKLDLIVAGVECTHHSRARGGRPKSDQRRSSAWHVLHWAEALRADELLIENVSEFQTWGPLDPEGRVIQERKGETFRAWILALESLGYRVEWRVLDCCDFGDPTSRRRLFIRASRRGAITWPEPSHGDGRPSPHRTAREIIDWSDLGTSIFTRKRPLADRTLARIEAGIRKFCGEMAEPFLVIMKGQSTVRSIDAPVPTITAHARHLALAYPFILPHDQFTGRNGFSLLDSIDRPMRTVTASNGSNTYLVSPFLVPHFGERPGQEPRTHSIDAPVPTVTATKGAGSLVCPFVVPYYGNDRPRSIDKPLGTVTTRDRFALVTPDGHALDIFFRMLQPRELAAAQGFPADFQFAGTKTDVVRQIGNAVPVNTAESLCLEVLEGLAA
ncbi:MAG: DNA cytosine methyltransferase [Acidobacteriota bacterium]